MKGVNGMAEFKRERVFFTVVGQGSIDITYEVGAETSIEAFRRTYAKGEFSSEVGVLIHEADDFDHVITCATEPTPHPDEAHVELLTNPTFVSDDELRTHLSDDHGVYNTQSQERRKLNWFHEQAHVIREQRRQEKQDCPDCGGTGMVMHGPNEVTCGTCDGRKVSVPRVEKTDDPDEVAPF